MSMTRKSTSLDGAERKGREARAAGLTEAHCPYVDVRKADGRLTWSRAYRNAWVVGFRGGKKCPLSRSHSKRLTAQDGQASPMNWLNDPKIDDAIRSALKDADRKGKLGVVAAVVGIAGGDDSLREIMNSTGELSIMDRGMLGMHLL